MMSNSDGSDTYRCEDCGIELKRPAFQDKLKGSVSASKLYTCVHGGSDRSFGGTTKVSKKGLTAIDVKDFEEQEVRISSVGQIPTTLTEEEIKGKTFKTVPLPDDWNVINGSVCVVLPTDSSPQGEVVRLLPNEFELI